MKFQLQKLYGIKNKYNIYYTILHIACELGNIDLVKYIISLKKIDIKSQIVVY